LVSVPLWLKGDVMPEAREMGNELPFIVQSRYCLAAGKWHTLLAMTYMIEERTGIRAFILGEIDMLLYRAICHYHLKNFEEALAELRKSYSLAKPHGFTAAFIEAGNEMRSLCEFALKSAYTGIDREWLAHIHSKSSSYAKRLAQVKQRILSGVAETPRLTRAERDMLAALARGMTRKEIAEDGHISLNTVKTILGDAIGKLGAHNATEAACIALAKGLLSK
jgi:DNA-binding CsgD family transcriptional regulator